MAMSILEEIMGDEFEDFKAEVYEELNKKLPKPGDQVTVPDGLKGEVQSVSILKQLVKVVVHLPNDEKEIREYPVEELRFKPRQKKGKTGPAPQGKDAKETKEAQKNSDKKEQTELLELEKLEKKERRSKKSKLDD